MRKIIEDGNDLGVPDGVLINGLGPLRYSESIVPDGITYATITVDPGILLYYNCYA